MQHPGFFECAEPDDLAFFDNRKYAGQFAGTLAGACIADVNAKWPPGATEQRRARRGMGRAERRRGGPPVRAGRRPAFTEWTREVAVLKQLGRPDRHA
jgi:hypothetical protein